MKPTPTCCCEFIMAPHTCTGSLAPRGPVELANPPPAALVCNPSHETLDSVGKRKPKNNNKKKQNNVGRRTADDAEDRRCDESNRMRAFGDVVSTPLDLSVVASRSEGCGRDSPLACFPLGRRTQHRCFCQHS